MQGSFHSYFGIIQGTAYFGISKFLVLHGHWIGSWPLSEKLTITLIDLPEDYVPYDIWERY